MVGQQVLNPAVFLWHKLLLPFSEFVAHVTPVFTYASYPLRTHLILPQLDNQKKNVWNMTVLNWNLPCGSEKKL
jgi:hypothetical protein